MRINVLISTIDQGIIKVSGILQPESQDVNYIISHQYRDEKYKTIPVALNRRDLIVSQIPGKGLSRNRNNALHLADGDIALIADDDVTYLPDAFETVRGVFEKDPSLDIACFKIKTNESEPEYKDYPNETYTLNNSSKHYISSIEIAFRVDRVREKRIVFDERFGLGVKKYASGEEELFIIDCIKAGLCAKYFPAYIVMHPILSSAKKTPKFDRTRIAMKGALDSRRFGYLSILKAFASAIIISPKLIKKSVNPLMYLYHRLAGTFYQLFSK